MNLSKIGNMKAKELKSYMLLAGDFFVAFIMVVQNILFEGGFVEVEFDFSQQGGIESFT